MKLKEQKNRMGKLYENRVQYSVSFNGVNWVGRWNARRVLVNKAIRKLANVLHVLQDFVFI